jgi:diketogulonate reductase-like aldo/keto reductase
MTPTAYNQVPIPSFMYGTAWKKDDTTRLVKLAVEAGFKAIDTANQLVHYNEALVGEALLELYKDGVVTRESLFLQTKFTSIGGQGNLAPPYDKNAKLADQVKQSFDSSLKHLHTDYLDSYVLHGPYYRNKLGAEDWEVWGAIEELYDSKKTRMIGISNVSAEQLDELVEKAKTKPMVVQNRCYAAMGWDQEVREICAEHNIIYQGFSLLTANQRVLSEPSVRQIADRLKTGVAQIIFRFAMQIGMLPLTGTTSAQRMKDDLKAEQLELTAGDMKELETVGMTARYS